MPPNIDPAAIFQAAANFEFSGQLLHAEWARHMDAKVEQATARGEKVKLDGVPTMWPSYVAYAFSLELYFKSMMQQDAGAYKTGHSLLKLFVALSDRQKRRITSKYECIRDNNPYWIQIKTRCPEEMAHLSLEKVLEDAKDVFAVFRYVFEGIGDTRLAGFLWAIRATRLVILEINPMWNDLVEPDLRTPPTSPTH